MPKPIVYFTREITPESLVKIYHKLDKKLKGKIGVKISTGEPGGHNYLKPELIGKLVNELKATIVECNTAYAGRRNTTEAHQQAIEEHGFTKIAKAHGKSVAQIIIRWHIEEGFSVIPGASNPDYIKENIEVFDFALSDEEMAQIRALNKEKRFFDVPFAQQKEAYLKIKMVD